MEMNWETGFAMESELEAVNELRRMVHALHVQHHPEVFQPVFDGGLSQLLFEEYRANPRNVVVARRDGRVCGYAVLEDIERKGSVFDIARRYMHVDEFGVAEDCRRQGAGTALLTFIREEAKARGYKRMDLSTWEFNKEAHALYEKMGFTTVRRYMETEI